MAQHCQCAKCGSRGSAVEETRILSPRPVPSCAQRNLATCLSNKCFSVLPSFSLRREGRKSLVGRCSSVKGYPDQFLCQLIGVHAGREDAALPSPNRQSHSFLPKVQERLILLVVATDMVSRMGAGRRAPSKQRNNSPSDRTWKPAT
jgi:hypothetical protein